MRRKSMHSAAMESDGAGKSRLKVRSNRDSDDIVNEALLGCLKEERRLELVESMRDGYRHMADINLQFAEIGFATDFNTLEHYESSLVSERD